MMKAEYIEHSGSDLMVVNAARVSFDVESEWDYIDYTPIRKPDGWMDKDTWAEDIVVNSEKVGRHVQPVAHPFETLPFLSERDTKLISYLARHKHWTPFAHPQITLRMTAPIFIRTQCFKHVVGFVANEVSRRYVDSEPDFFMPEVWRGRSESAKQGSAAEAADWFGDLDKEEVAGFYAEAKRIYEHLTDSCGVCPEQARMVLPQAMMTQWYWTGSLAAYARFYVQRTDPHAQNEVQDLARMVGDVIAPLFPVSWEALTANVAISS